MNKKEWHIQEEKEMNTIAQDILSFLKEKARLDGATILTLSGDLGAGKTTFTQKIARLLGVAESVTSPTFVIQKKYSISNESVDATAQKFFTELVHIDAYRLHSGHEMEVLGWQRLISQPNTLIIIEWPEKIADILDIPHFNITFTPSHIIGEESIRTLCFDVLP